MDKSTIIHLNKLNANFYSKVAREFDVSRKNPWQGWRNLLPIIQSISQQKKHLDILDVGCGNGRFATFLAEHLSPSLFTYTGIDASEELLTAAKKRTKGAHFPSSFHQVDLVNALQTDTPLNPSADTKYDLILLIAVLHHIPAQSLRLELLQQLRLLLKPNSFLITTTWNFANLESLAGKVVNPTHIDLDPTLLEQHDYILNWNNRTDTYRYCHFFEPAESTQLFDQAGLEIVDFFFSDGHNRQLNTYYLLARKGYNERHNA